MGFKGGLFISKAGTVSENLRGYYQSTQKSTFVDDYCLWWHKPYRHWWIGHCSSRGDNSGLAWLEPDVLCPNMSQDGWRRGGSDTKLTGFARIANASEAIMTAIKATSGGRGTDVTSEGALAA